MIVIMILKQLKYILNIIYKLHNNFLKTKYSYLYLLICVSIIIILLLEIQIESILSIIQKESIYISIANNKSIIPNVLSIMKYIGQGQIMCILVYCILFKYLEIEIEKRKYLNIILIVIINVVLLCITIYYLYNILNICTKQVENVSIVKVEVLYKVLNKEILIGRDNTETVLELINTNNTILETELSEISKEYIPEVVAKCNYNLKEQELLQKLLDSKSLEESKYILQEHNQYVKTHYRVCLDICQEQLDKKVIDCFQPGSNLLSFKQIAGANKINMVEKALDFQPGSKNLSFREIVLEKQMDMAENGIKEVLDEEGKKEVGANTNVLPNGDDYDIYGSTSFTKFKKLIYY